MIQADTEQPKLGGTRFFFFAASHQRYRRTLLSCHSNVASRSGRTVACHIDLASGRCEL